LTRFLTKEANAFFMWMAPRNLPSASTHCLSFMRFSEGVCEKNSSVYAAASCGPRRADLLANHPIKSIGGCCARRA
jgi:hypothetical protein